MRTSLRNSVSGGVLVAGAAVLLTACASQPTVGAASPAAVSEAAATDSASPTTESPDPAADALAAGLLPESAFGDGAEVFRWPGDRSDRWPGHDRDHDDDGDSDDGDRGHGGWRGPGGWWGAGGWWGSADGASVEPAACADVLGTLPDLHDAELTTVGQVARTDQLRTSQVLAEGSALSGLELPVDQLLANCSNVTVSAPWGMTATVSLTALDVAVPARGESTAALAIAVTSPAGSWSSLVGVVTQGSRAMLLSQSGKDGTAPAQDGFTALLDQAADAASFD